MPRPPRLSDLLTTANLACGVASVLLASQGQLTIACGLIFLGALFDVFDGLAARALGGGSPLGAQLDSLADMVTFGTAPALIIWFGTLQGWGRNIHQAMIGNGRVVGDHVGHILPNDVIGPSLLPFFLALIPICAAWRLAKFNIDTRQSSGFLGLATPANGLYWASLPLIMARTGVVNGPGAEVLHALATWPLWSAQVLAIISVVLCVLMLSELPLPSLKLKHKGWKGNEVIFLLIGLSAVLAVLYGILAVPLVLGLYLLSPLWGKLFRPPDPSR